MSLATVHEFQTVYLPSLATSLGAHTVSCVPLHHEICAPLAHIVQGRQTLLVTDQSLLKVPFEEKQNKTLEK